MGRPRLTSKLLHRLFYLCVMTHLRTYCMTVYYVINDSCYECLGWDFFIRTFIPDFDVIDQFQKLELFWGRGRQQRQINPAGDSPFPLRLPSLKRDGGAKPQRNAKNKNATLHPRRSPTLLCPHVPQKFYARIGLLTHHRGHQIRGGCNVRKKWCSDISQCRRCQRIPG